MLSNLIHVTQKNYITDLGPIMLYAFFLILFLKKMHIAYSYSYLNHLHLNIKKLNSEL